MIIKPQGDFLISLRGRHLKDGHILFSSKVLTEHGKPGETKPEESAVDNYEHEPIAPNPSFKNHVGRIKWGIENGRSGVFHLSFDYFKGGKIDNLKDG